MKIAYVVPSLINKGPIIVVDTLIRNLIGSVDQIDVYYFDDKFGTPFVCPTFKIDFNKPIDFDQYDIIHTHGFRPDKYVKKWRNKIKKAKTVSTIHSDILIDLKYSYNPVISLFFTPYWLRQLKKHDLVAVISDKLKGRYKNKFSNIVRVHNGIDIDLKIASADPGIVTEIKKLKETGYKVIGTYAYITKIKGLEQLIELLKLRKDLAVVIIGQGEAKDELVSLAKKLKVDNRVLFFGYLPVPYNYIPFFDAYAICSRSEGFGLALVEAALTKSSIICSDIEVFHEIFDNSQVSYFELDNLSSLSNAVDVALSESGKNKGEEAYQHSLKYFSGKTMAENYLKVYNKIITDGEI